MDYELIKNIKLSDWNCQPVEHKLYYIYSNKTYNCNKAYISLIKIN